MKQKSVACVPKPALRVLFLASLLSFVPAASHALEIRGIVKAGYDGGGDTLINVPTVSPVSIQNIKANEGIVFAGGLSFLNDSRNFAVEATIGSKSENFNGNLQDYQFHRGTVDILGFVSQPLSGTTKSQFRFGIGTTYHFKTTVEESGSIANNKTKFDDAWGYVAQVDTVFAIARGKMGVNAGLRYTNINYKAIGIPTLKAAGLGVFIGVIFPVGL